MRHQFTRAVRVPARKALGSLLVAASLLTSVEAAAEPPPLEAYAALPVVSMLRVSPDGTRIAFRQITDGQDLVVVRDLATNKLIGGTDVSSVNPRRLYFPDNDKVVLIASKSVRELSNRGRYQSSDGFVLDVSSGKTSRLLARAEDIYPEQSGLGYIAGQSDDGGTLYMPAFTAKGDGNARYSVYRVGLNARRATILAPGTFNTIDWLIGQDGKVLLEEEYDNKESAYRLWGRDGSKRR
ncbi:MAG: hypothetical protein AAGD86_14420, partial [Pseudomonadota bacterium]